MKLCILILGYGEMGHAMEYLLGVRHDVRIWNRGGMRRWRMSSAMRRWSSISGEMLCGFSRGGDT